MAGTDITALIKERGANNDYQQPLITRTYTIDVTEPQFDGIETAATHNLVAIPKGEALVGGYVVVQTSFAGSSTTVTFQVGSDGLSGAIPEANLAAGDVVQLNFAISAATETKATYAKAAADTLDWAVGTAALTAGKCVLVLQFLDVATILAQGKIR